MNIKKLRPISWIFALLICLLFPAMGNCQEYEVKLNNGRVIRTKQYYEKDGTIYLLRYGNYVGYEKSEVVEIVKKQDAPSSSAANSPKRAGSGAKTSASPAPKGYLLTNPRALVPQPKKEQATENAGQGNP